MSKHEESPTVEASSSPIGYAPGSRWRHRGAVIVVDRFDGHRLTYHYEDGNGAGWMGYHHWKHLEPAGS